MAWIGCQTKEGVVLSEDAAELKGGQVYRKTGQRKRNIWKWLVKEGIHVIQKKFHSIAAIKVDILIKSTINDRRCTLKS